MPLTSAQQTSIKRILTQHSRDVHSALKKHKSRITKIVGDIDKKKLEKIHRLIQNAS